MLGSETGCWPVDPADVKRLGRLAPGKLFLVRTSEQGRGESSRTTRSSARLPGSSPRATGTATTSCTSTTSSRHT